MASALAARLFWMVSWHQLEPCCALFTPGSLHPMQSIQFLLLPQPVIVYLPHSGHMLQYAQERADSMFPAAEIATGKGILGQVALETGVPQSWVEIGLLVLLGYNVVAVGLDACGSLRASSMPHCITWAAHLLCHLIWHRSAGTAWPAVLLAPELCTPCAAQHTPASGCLALLLRKKNGSLHILLL